MRNLKNANTVIYMLVLLIFITFFLFGTGMDIHSKISLTIKDFIGFIIIFGGFSSYIGSNVINKIGRVGKIFLSDNNTIKTGIIPEKLIESVSKGQKYVIFEIIDSQKNHIS